MRWFKKKATPSEQPPVQQAVQAPRHQPLSQEEFRKRMQECYEQLTPEERDELQKANERREAMSEWERDLEEKIRSGEATVVTGHNWQQIIVDGEVVMFIDGCGEPDGAYGDL